MYNMCNMISFNVPPNSQKGGEYVNDAIASHKICGDGNYTKNVMNGLMTECLLKAF